MSFSKLTFNPAIFIVTALLCGWLAACGNTPSVTPASNPTEAASANTSVTSNLQSTTKAPPLPSSAARTTVATGTRAALLPTAVAVNLPSLTDKLPERSIVRTFTDLDGRQVHLTYGRGTGYNGDYGWAHIYGKHVQGIWYDGGTVTTFTKSLGTKSPEQVVALLEKSVQDRRPDAEPNGRRSYVYQVPNTNSDVFMVVGNDGTVITAYPVRRGSQDGG